MRKSLVSMVALGLFLGAPALADTDMAQTTTIDQQQTQQMQQQTFTAEQFEQLLSGFEERSELEGHLARATTSDGNDVLVFVGPRDLDADESFEAQESDIRERFQEAGFTGMQSLDEVRIARANLDDEHYIFALSADRLTRLGTEVGAMTGETGAEMGRDETALGQTDTDTSVEMGQTEMDMDPQTGAGTATQMGQTDLETDTQTGAGTDTQMGQTDLETDTQIGAGTDTQMGQADLETDTQTGAQMDTDAEARQIGRALSEPDADRIVSDIEGAGFENAEEFQGRIVRARSEDGAPVFFLITPRDMTADAGLEINEDEVREKLQEADLQDIQFVDDAKIVRGEFEDNSVFVLAGDLTGRGIQQ
jgi:hypothetical protein